MSEPGTTIYCPHRGGPKLECETPNACAGGADCRRGSDPLHQTTRTEAWAESHATINRFGSREYSPFVCHVMNLFDPRARRLECECSWVAPYGFVVEAGCSEHD